MSKGAYIGVGGVARKIKNIYIGVDGVARKVKKAWIGVNGVARLFYSSEPSYYTTLSNMSTGTGSSTVSDRGKAKNPSYAMFCFGNTKNVDSYNKSLTHSILQAHSFNACVETCGAWIGQYAISDYGYIQGEGTSKSLLTYDESLTKKTYSEILSSKGRERNSGELPSYAVITGGNSSSEYISGRTNLYALNASMSCTSNIYLSEGRVSVGAATVDGVLIFAGGSISTSKCSKVVDSYNNSLTRTIATSLSVPKDIAASGTVGNHALFISGHNRATDENIGEIEIYNSSLTKTIVADDSVKSWDGDATSLGEYLIAGLQTPKKVYMWDASLTKTTLQPLTDWANRTYAKVIDVGNYALYAGGNNSPYVDVYSI